MHPFAADSDTIAALATPPGDAALAVIRLSGPRALEIADRVFLPAARNAPHPSEAPTHTLHYGHVIRHGQRVDEILLAVLRSPRTFTREDCVELSCHGGAFVAREVLATVLAAGARPAQPGEFSRRAFLNGRLDLAQAEAVADVIHARTERALTAAQEQLAGSLSRPLNQLRESFLITLAHLEAHLDFPDDDIAPDSREALLHRLDQGILQLDALIATAREGHILRQGLRTTLIGRPNAGKSSLLNQLLSRDRAIVSPIPGTTRDTLEEATNLLGFPIVFTDTAGLRPPADTLEEEGIRRTHQAAEQSQLILQVLDASEPLSDSDLHDLNAFAHFPRLIILNKSDLPRRLTLPPSAPFQPIPPIPVSCLTGDGLPALKSAIIAHAQTRPSRTALPHIAINTRHEHALRRARETAATARDALQQSLPFDLVAPDLRLALQAIGEVTGHTSTEDLLDAVFSQFCLGK
jgi:tRNA modification GTPase